MHQRVLRWRDADRDRLLAVMGAEPRLDDHADADTGAERGVYRIDHALTARDNLEVQTAVIAGADAADAKPDEEPESFGVPEAEITAQVDVAAWSAAKRTAMDCHKTQRQDFGWLLDLPDDLATRILSPDISILDHTAPPTPILRTLAQAPKISPHVASSTSSPAYITPTRSLTRAMTPRLWLINRMAVSKSRRVTSPTPLGSATGRS